jgi:hypothetical protein
VWFGSKPHCIEELPFTCSSDDMLIVNLVSNLHNSCCSILNDGAVLILQSDKVISDGVSNQINIVNIFVARIMLVVPSKL